MTTTRIVILGAGFAGMMSALRLSRLLRHVKGNTLEMTLVNAAPVFVERTRLHQFATGQRPRVRQIADLLAGTRVHFVQAMATSVDPERCQIHAQSAQGLQTLPYDYLIYALGSQTNRDAIPGLHRAYSLDASGAQQLARELPQVAERRGRVLIIGGGLTGIEAATEIAESFPAARVTLTMRGRLGGDLSAKGAAHVRQVFHRLGIEVRDNTDLARVEADRAIARTGEPLPFDVAVNCAGFRVPALAREAGFAVNEQGQLLIDAYSRAINHPNVFGAGDAAAFEAAANMPLRMACATALPMAAAAADNLVATLTQHELQPFRFGYVIQCISLGRHDGLVQRVDAHDVPFDSIITGRAGVWIKERILRFVDTSLKYESRFGVYRGSAALTAHAPSAHADQPEHALSLASEP